MVRDIIGMSLVHLTVTMFSLKLETSPNRRAGGYTDPQLYSILSVLYAAESSSLSPGRSYELRNQAKVGMQKITRTILRIRKGGKACSLRGYGQQMAQRQVNRDANPSREASAARSAALAAWSANVPLLLLAESINLHLGEGAGHLSRLRALTLENTDDARNILKQQ